MEAQGGKEDFGKGKGRKRDRKEGGRAVREREKELSKRVFVMSAQEYCHNPTQHQPNNNLT